MTTEHTKLTLANGYDTGRMIFSSPIIGSVPDSKPKIEFKRINISTLNEDGTEGELILKTPDRLFSFGVTENLSEESKKVTGYTFPICLWNKDAPTEEQKTWTDTFENIVEQCIEHLLENKEEVELYDLTREELTKSKGGLNPLYWKKDKATDERTGKVVQRKVPGQGPTLYAKLIYSKKSNKFFSQFYNPQGEAINVNDLMNSKYCHVSAAIKIESIFISGTGKISLQVKIYEAVIEQGGNHGMKRLMTARPQASVQVLSSAETLAGNVLSCSDSTSEDGSLTEEKPPVKRLVRRVVKN